MKYDAEEMLFSVKSYLGAMLAFYVALRIGLVRPYWAVTTSYIVAQPLAGAVLSKAAFRLVGTALGATAAVVLVPSFVNEPAVLSAALGAWLGLCLYISLLDRTPRAYTFLLAGYTASIIGFPSVNAPGAIFDVAILRVQEITIGILCGSLVHALIFPRSVTERLFARIDAVLLDAERWSILALAGSPEAVQPAEQRRIAIDLNELDQLSVHLPFDTARLVPRVRTVRALQDRLLELLPLGTTVEDRRNALMEAGGLPREIEQLLADARTWLAGAGTDRERDAHAAALIGRIESGIVFPDQPTWRDLLTLNLRSRLADLIAVHRDIRLLRDQLRSPGVAPIAPLVADLLARARGRSLHRDYGLALRSALGTFACVALGCAFWIGTAWPDGAGAVLMAGVCCALFGSAEQPGATIFLFLVGSAVGLFASMIYAYAVMPRVTSFEVMAAVMAPALLLIGSFMARPRNGLIATGVLLGFTNTVGFNATYQADFPSFINGAIAQLAGTGFAVISVGLFQTVGTEHGIARLFRAGWRDVARRAQGQAGDERGWASRMLDRVGLLLPRLASRPAPERESLLDALVDMRVGIVSGRLRRLDGALPPALDATLAGVATHYRQLDPRHPAPPPPTLLDSIDRSIGEFAADPEPGRRREGLVLLTSLRRNLFPSAHGYNPA